MPLTWPRTVPFTFRTATLFVALLVGAIPYLGAAESPSAEEVFESEVRPVLVDACWKCHGPRKQHGGLRLDSREATIVGGDRGPAIVPGQPNASPLIAAIRRAGELKMPPDRPLTDRQVSALTAWVQAGAHWPVSPNAITSANGPRSIAADHWAFRPVRSPALPEVRDTSWVRTPVDRFILHKLEVEGLTPSPAADRRTLIRRATYDLTGLPPTSEQVDAFVRDSSPTSYERLIDRLLASPQYGEQWGRHWLDVARYSDTKGYVYGREERFWVHAWAYRDWVITAINRDMPYDRFLTLQLAADQVAANDPSAQAAMGYLTLGRRFLGVTHDIIDDRIDTVTRGMLGLTVACARCHDHKFDPIPTTDYYSLYGVFKSCTEQVVPASTTKLDPTFAAEFQKRSQKLASVTAKRRAEAADRARVRVADYLEAQLELNKYPEEGFDQILAATDLIPSTVRRWRDYLARPTTVRGPVFAVWHAFAAIPTAEFASRAPEVWRSLSATLPANANGAVTRAFTTPPRDMREVARRYGELFTRIEPRRRIALSIVGGALVVPPEGVTDADANTLRAVLNGPDSPCEVPDEPIVNAEGFYPSDVVTELWKLQGDVDRWLIQSPAAPAYATVLADRPTPMDARVFRRGNPATPTTVVPRQFLEVVAGPNRRPFTRGSGRLELAKAIADPANPLTARVMVNRVWMHHFGTGLVRTPSDFGTRAEPPSHPGLLDALATRFVASGWSLKTLHREIVLSSAYRQASTGPADPVVRDRAMARDPGNRWLWRANARRLSFEEMRDSLFAITSDLDFRAGGKPSDLLTTPYSPRRSVYGLVDRQFPPELFRVFDAANPDLHVPQRSETTVPQQALFFLNHPLPIARARALAAHSTVSSALSPEAKVRQLYRLVYQRDPTPNQVTAAIALVRATEAELASPPPTRKTAWSYGVATFDAQSGTVTGFHALPYFTGNAWQGGSAWPDSRWGWAQLTATGGHPGNDLAHAVVRRWTAPSEGTFQIRSQLVHQEAAGDGVRATVIGSRHGRLATAKAHNSQAALNVAKVEARRGDTIDFVTDIGGTLNTDQHLWAPVIQDTATGKVWDARADFSGPARPQLGSWEQLAQALLMANEFCFVD